MIGNFKHFAIFTGHIHTIRFGLNVIFICHSRLIRTIQTFTFALSYWTNILTNPIVSLAYTCIDARKGKVGAINSVRNNSNNNILSIVNTSDNERPSTVTLVGIFSWRSCTNHIISDIVIIRKIRIALIIPNNIYFDFQKFRSIRASGRCGSLAHNGNIITVINSLRAIIIRNRSVLRVSAQF